jgi:uncharacterized repeat protein (TIGR03803 family)
VRHTTSTSQRILTNAWTPLLALALFLAIPPSANAASTIYAITNAGDFGTLNLSTGAFAKLGASGVEPAGLAELGSNLYISNVRGHTLSQVSLTNGSLTTVGNGSIVYNCLGATTSVLYAIGTDANLYSINAANGASIAIGSTGLTLNGCAMSADASVLYAAVDNGSGSVLYSVNLSTGVTSPIGNTGLSLISSMIYQNNLLYAATNGGALYTLNTQTGGATFVASIGVPVWGMALPASAFTGLHTFTNGQDGGMPRAGLTMDRGGSLYGTAFAGGSHSSGTVFKLTHKGSGWTFSPLYEFEGGPDGAFPQGPVTIGPDGSLYGTTYEGGVMNNGTVYRLRPPATSCRSALCFWTETQLYAFDGDPDGADPAYGGVVFDSAGNLYGTTLGGGKRNVGTVYELTPSGPPWTENILYSFQASPDGCDPYAGLTFDQSGNLYGTTFQCGAYSAGTVYQLTPSGFSWTEGILVAFQGQSDNDGASPVGGLVFDRLGNAYGTTSHGGIGGGTVYELTPSNGGWTYTQIYEFAGVHLGPYGGLVIDGTGNLYGTTNTGGLGYGTVFELSPSNGNWVYTDLYDFTDGSDGANPIGSLVLDSAGKLYGTASGGGNGYGTIFEVTPN